MSAWLEEEGQLVKLSSSRFGNPPIFCSLFIELWYLIPLEWISTSPDCLLPSNEGRT